LEVTLNFGLEISLDKMWDRKVVRERRGRGVNNAKTCIRSDETSLQIQREEFAQVKFVTLEVPGSYHEIKW
jgi:hypothetical protein